MTESKRTQGRRLSLAMLALMIMCTTQVVMRLSREGRTGGLPDGTVVCRSHLTALDRMMAEWESRTAPLPPDQEFWVDIRSDGRIEWLSPNFDSFFLTRNIETARRLVAPGGTTLLELAKGEHFFSCPQPVPGSSLPGAVHYRWISGPTPRPEFGGRKRGTICLNTARGAPPTTPERTHAFF